MRSGRSPRCSAASDAGGAPDAVSPADDPEAQLLPVITGIMQSGRAAVRPEKRALLSALRPFVAEDVASQFDRALRLAGMAGMARAALGQSSTSTWPKEASILYNRDPAESTPSAAPETPPLSPLLPSLPRLDRDALITLAAAFFLLTDGDRGNRLGKRHSGPHPAVSRVLDCRETTADKLKGRVVRSPFPVFIPYPAFRMRDPPSFA